MERDRREEARRRRAPLRAAAGELERAISAPVGTGPVWRDRVRESLNSVRVALRQHIEDTEGANGLYIELRENAPRLTNLVILLEDEHSTLDTAIDDSLAALDSLSDEFDTDDAEPVRESVLFLLGKISRHRQKGADLVWRAYSVDIGGDS
jgi:hypothetical protein